MLESEEDNQNKDSMMHFLQELSKDLNGNTNYVFKSLSLLIKIHEHFDKKSQIFTRNFQTFQPAVVIPKDMSEYKHEIKETVAICCARILASHIKFSFIESHQESDSIRKKVVNLCTSIK